MRFWLRSPFLCNNNFFMKWIILHLAIYRLIGFIVSGSGMNGFSWALWLWYSSASQFTWFSSNQWLWAIMYINSNCIILLFELWFFFSFLGNVGGQGVGFGVAGQAWRGKEPLVSLLETLLLAAIWSYYYPCFMSEIDLWM